MNIGNLLSLMKQASRVRSEMDRVRGELDKITADGSAGGGMVRVKVNGKTELIECKIEPHVFADGDVELLEDLFVAAANQAIEKVREASAEQMKKMVGDLDVPGLNEALSQITSTG